MAEYGKQGKARLMNFKDWVPDWLRIVIYAMFVVVFQFSNGFYFTTMMQLEGARNLTMSDTHMMGQTLLTGLCFYFPLAFRLKFRFTNKTSLTLAAAGQLIVNLIFPNVHSFPLLLALCYIGGFFRLYGTFECFSNLLPKVTPTYNYAVFLSFVFFIVIGCVGVFDWLAIHIIYYYGWKHVHLAAVGLCLLVLLMVRIFMRDFRPVPKMRLLGIDWLGMCMWTIVILSMLFVVAYGEELEWLNSPRIRVAIGISIVMLALCFLRMNHIRHSFIEYGAFKCPNLFNLMILFLGLDILLASQNVLQNAFMSGVLHYGQLTVAQLKWPEFLGAAAAALFCWLARTQLKWHLKTITFWTMGAMMLYEFIMMRMIWPGISISYLWLPSFFIGFGHVGVFIVLTVYAQAYCNFKYYFQVLCILGFIRMGVGDLIGTAVWSRLMNGLMGQHIADIGMAADYSAAPFHQLAENVAQAALLSTIRELYGWAVVIGVVLLLLILVGHFDALRNPLPKLRQAYAIIRKRRIIEREKNNKNHK
ncbi:MAG: hypothetical protein IJ607_02275 [Bacteroidaceae bacterium]|nr:hypothetical protein [Bacteroidaceae bacterium]